MFKYVTAETVSPGHPDKIADLISDYVLTKALENNPSSRVAVETVLTGTKDGGLVMVGGEISDIANLSINETLARTIITSATTLLALFSIFILGGEILRGFSFAMILGVFIGTYSSIFVASPILKVFKVSHKTLEKEEDKIVP